MNFIIDEMQICRDYCSLIHKAREKAGFHSLKYPITDVKINYYFLPEFRELIADECNIAGYMDIQPVEYEFDNDDIWENVPKHYFLLTEGDKKVLISTVKSDWQQDIFEERSKKRLEAAKRKELSI